MSSIASKMLVLPARPLLLVLLLLLLLLLLPLQQYPV